MRGRALWGALAAGLVACNALTGADSLGVAADVHLTADASPDDEGSSGGPDVVVRKDGGTVTDAPPGDGALSPEPDADAGDVPDATVDTGPPPVEAGPCVPASVGPRYGTAANGFTWSEDNGALAPDNSRAHSNGDNTNPLVTSGYGFALPANAEVKGIRVVIARSAAGPVSDNAVALPKGNSKANGAWPAGAYDGPYIPTTYGSATDLWGTTWTAAEINATSFGVSLKVSGAGDGHVDSIAITVDYCVP